MAKKENRKTFLLKTLFVVCTTIASVGLGSSVYYANPAGPYTVFGRGNNNAPAAASAYGTHGSISIPEVGYVMPLDELTDPETAQSVIDRRDRAGIVLYGNQDWIADHNYNGFHLMGGAVPGETKAYISYPDGTYETYLCTDNFIGRNAGGAITTEDGTMIDEPGKLGMFTCTYDCKRVRVTLWEKVEKSGGNGTF